MHTYHMNKTGSSNTPTLNYMIKTIYHWPTRNFLDLTKSCKINS